MDQVSGACALPCRGPYLGHPAGGGTSWVDGNRALFAQAKTALGTGRAVVSESNAEVYLSSIDGFLSLYGWNNCGARQPSCPTTAAGPATTLTICLPQEPSPHSRAFTVDSP